MEVILLVRHLLGVFLVPLCRLALLGNPPPHANAAARRLRRLRNPLWHRWLLRFLSGSRWLPLWHLFIIISMRFNRNTSIINGWLIMRLPLRHHFIIIPHSPAV